MYQLERVKRLAEQVRAAFEERVGGDLGGVCARASIEFHLAAERLGVSGVELCVGSGHIYNMYEDYVIDITATQFDVKDPVLVVRLLDLPKKVAGCSSGCNPWQQYARFRSLKEAKESSRWWGGDADKDFLDVVMRHTGELVTNVTSKEATV
jgi:hypothetical protein